MASNKAVKSWVEEVQRLCQPKDVVWCDGSEAEKQRLTERALARNELFALNPEKLPGCYCHRSDPGDVARTEHLTFICTPAKVDAGPNNNWMAPSDAKQKLTELFRGAMKGRTLYVVPFVMGPVGSPFSKVGVQVTDSIYVVLNMRIMTRMGEVALKQLGGSDDFTRCFHSLGDLSPDRRYICHFPETNEIWSVGSGYGGNALLGKKCLALRIASQLGRKEGWLAEHMLVLGVENPQGETHYITGAFPSACGKTNLAMLIPPAEMPGWKVWTIGDDIAWLRIGEDGRLWATNPEAGFFGVVPGTSRSTNPNAMASIAKNTIYTNVAVRPDNTVWWEGHSDPPPAHAVDWQGKPWTPASGTPAAHPNSRFTSPAAQCPSISPEWESPRGVPISAMLFGARRQTAVPLVYEATSWQHGAYMGAALSSETTAAATGKVGVVRRDPMAMSPFCGYNFADYFAHWLDMGKRLKHPPKIFRVNWFRKGDNGKFLWPGFGQNLRVLKWVVERATGRGAAVPSPLGHLPTPDAIDRRGLDVSDAAMAELLRVDKTEWADDLKDLGAYLAQFGERMPAGILEEHAAQLQRLS